jgi:hypothetical protein
VLFPVWSLIAAITRLGILGGGAPLVQVADTFTRQRISWEMRQDSDLEAQRM